MVPIESLPSDLEGEYRSEELETVWRFVRDASGAITLTVEGPLSRRSGWTVVPVQPDLFWVRIPLRWLPSMLDVRVIRDSDQEILGLSVSGGRAKAVYFSRQPDAF
jgi:hypothetical protein